MTNARRDSQKDRRQAVTLSGIKLLHDPELNKGTAFTEAEREALGLRGLLPSFVFTMSEQVKRVMETFHNKPDDLEKYISMIALMDRNETLFYRTVIDHIEEMMPILYTPTVGQACQKYGHIFRRPRGMFISAHDRGEIAAILKNWPHDNVRVIVVTDGERILGLGDLGAYGMGIPVGKLTLYTACAGIDPSVCLPICLDVGCDRDEVREDPLYIGLRQKRLRGQAYDTLIEEFIQAVTARFSGVLVQFEDFGCANALRLLETYRQRICCFNDDIQGTAVVTLAGLHSALRITRVPLTGQRFLFLGAGEAGIGIGHLLVSTLVQEGLTRAEARRRCWFVDSRGLVVKGRGDLAEHKVPFAHDHERMADLRRAIDVLKPTALIGASGQTNAFTPEVLAAMANHNERPIVFALSNPTSKAECTAESAYLHTAGRAVFASGSPFGPVAFEGRTYVPGQANNAYVFPGVGLGVVATGAKRVTDTMFAAAAAALAKETTEDDLAKGCILPPLNRIRGISLAIAKAVAAIAFQEDLATIPTPDDLHALIASNIYEPNYRDYL